MSSPGTVPGIAVTQADKDAAADCAHALGMEAEAFTSGACDILVQAFARHRVAASLTAAATVLRDAHLLPQADYQRTINRIQARERLREIMA